MDDQPGEELTDSELLACAVAEHPAFRSAQPGLPGPPSTGSGLADPTDRAGPTTPLG